MSYDVQINTEESAMSHLKYCFPKHSTGKRFRLPLMYCVVLLNVLYRWSVCLCYVYCVLVYCVLYCCFVYLWWSLALCYVYLCLCVLLLCGGLVCTCVLCTVYCCFVVASSSLRNWQFQSMGLASINHCTAGVRTVSANQTNFLLWRLSYFLDGAKYGHKMAMLTHS